MAGDRKGLIPRGSVLEEMKKDLTVTETD